MKKTYISAASLLQDSFKLALKVMESGWRPTHVVGVWRGGTPVGIAVQEALAFAGCATAHMPVRITSYTGIGEQGRIEMDGLELVARLASPDSRILLVDDVHDSGQSMAHLLDGLVALGLPRSCLRVAVPWFKPQHSTTPYQPDYYLHETADWLVFPHELCGLTTEEVLRKPDLEGVAAKLLAHGAETGT